MGVFSQSFRRPYAPPPDSLDTSGNSSNQTFLGTGDPNLIRVSTDPSTADDSVQVAQQSPMPRRGVFPVTEPPALRPLPSNLGEPVTLPDGSFVPDRFSPTGQLMSPIRDLSAVAKAGRAMGADSRVLLADPSTFESGTTLEAARTGFALGHGGQFDYQRGPGNSVTGFEQRRQFRNVSNVNVGLFGQQAGWSLDRVLRQAGEFAGIKSSNYRANEPYGLDPQAREFIELGYRIGASGVYGPAVTR